MLIRFFGQGQFAIAGADLYMDGEFLVFTDDDRADRITNFQNVMRQEPSEIKNFYKKNEYKKT